MFTFKVSSMVQGPKCEQCSKSQNTDCASPWKADLKKTTRRVLYSCFSHIVKKNFGGRITLMHTHTKKKKSVLRIETTFRYMFCELSWIYDVFPKIAISPTQSCYMGKHACLEWVLIVTTVCIAALFKIANKVSGLGLELPRPSQATFQI